jgi:Ca2+-binding RTX toxin-like protein
MKSLSRTRPIGKANQSRPCSSMARGLPAVIAGAAMLLVLLPASGEAAPEADATLQVAPFTVNPGQTAPGQAFCPAGRRVVGGGVTQSSGPVNGSAVEVGGPLDETGLASNLQDGDIGRSWYTAVRNSGVTPSTFAATAVCSASSDATIRIDPFTVQGLQSGDGQAFCPSGSRVIGGGVTQSVGPLGSGENVSGPLDQTGLTSNLSNGDVGRSWYANVYSYGGGAGSQSTFVSTAICSSASDATIAVDFFDVQGHGEGDGQPFCPNGTRVIGGGVTQSAGTGASSNVHVSGPLDETGLTSNLTTGDVGESFYASVGNVGSGPSTFASTAICATPTLTTAGATSTTAGDVQKCHGKTATIAARQGIYGRKFTGTPNNDVIVGTSNRDEINAGAGNDLFCAGKGNDLVKGGKGKDKLYGEGGDDTLLGQRGADLLSGGPGKRDHCAGGSGKDIEKNC